MSDSKEKLAAMLDAIVNDKPEEAQIAFHGYLGDKMKAEIHSGSGDVNPGTANDKD